MPVRACTRVCACVATRVYAHVRVCVSVCTCPCVLRVHVHFFPPQSPALCRGQSARWHSAPQYLAPLGPLGHLAQRLRDAAASVLPTSCPTALADVRPHPLQLLARNTAKVSAAAVGEVELNCPRLAPLAARLRAMSRAVDPAASPGTLVPMKFSEPAPGAKPDIIDMMLLPGPKPAIMLPPTKVSPALTRVFLVPSAPRSSSTLTAAAWLNRAANISGVNVG
mmetsp:Transcript_6082/g.15495  ORF Transcript_6082/g.15495 Transcript_6082/m.15495 type:complete len:223 (-) Transcript_6082:809-1477(-)